MSAGTRGGQATQWVEPAPIYDTPPQLVSADFAEESPYETAHLIAKHGWRAVPLDHPELAQCAGIGRDHDPKTCDSRGKCPCVAFSHAASSNPKMIDMWWAGRRRNVGIYMSGSGLFVVDEDLLDALAKYAAKHGHQIPETFTVKTANGRHYYFQDTENGAIGNHEGAFQGLGINIRSGNAYVVGPGSVHKSGVVYGVEKFAPIVPVPRWIVDACKASSNGHKNSEGPFANPDDYGPGFELPEVIKGKTRDNTLIAYAGQLREYAVPYKIAIHSMKEAWRRCEQPPKAQDEYTWKKALSKLDGAYSRWPEGERRDNSQQHDSTRHLRVTKAADIQIRATRWLWEEDHAHWIAVGSLVGLSGR
jgi:Bifunctional DNA primase/polymerase, N-terminal